jgi:hypothetical protein
MPHPVHFPFNTPRNFLLTPPPLPTDSLARFAGYDAVVLTYTNPETEAFAKIWTPLAPVNTWYKYRHNQAAYDAAVTNQHCAYWDADRDPQNLWFRIPALYIPVQVGTKLVLVVKSGLHFSTDGPALPLQMLVTDIATQIAPKVLITTGTAGAIGDIMQVGTIYFSTILQFRCTGQYATEPWAHTAYPITPPSTAARNAITPKLLARNGLLLPAHATPPVWYFNSGPILTTDSFQFDDSTDHYGLQGHGAMTEMDDACVAQALVPYPGITIHAVRNASDPQIPNPNNDIAAARVVAYKYYRKYGAASTAGSAVACWAIVATM